MKEIQTLLCRRSDCRPADQRVASLSESLQIAMPPRYEPAYTIQNTHNRPRPVVHDPSSHQDARFSSSFRNVIPLSSCPLTFLIPPTFSHPPPDITMCQNGQISSECAAHQRLQSVLTPQLFIPCTVSKLSLAWPDRRHRDPGSTSPFSSDLSGEFDAEPPRPSASASNFCFRFVSALWRANWAATRFAFQHN